LVKLKFCQICLNLFKRVRLNSLLITNSLFIRPIQPIIQQIQPIFVFLKNSCSFRSSNAFRSNFSEFYRIFPNFIKYDGFAHLRIFKHCLQSAGGYSSSHATRPRRPNLPKRLPRSTWRPALSCLQTVWSVPGMERRQPVPWSSQFPWFSAPWHVVMITYLLLAWLAIRLSPGCHDQGDQNGS
jgi:hypothetical protein